MLIDGALPILRGAISNAGVAGADCIIGAAKSGSSGKTMLGTSASSGRLRIGIGGLEVDPVLSGGGGGIFMGSGLKLEDLGGVGVFLQGLWRCGI